MYYAAVVSIAILVIWVGLAASGINLPVPTGRNGENGAVSWLISLLIFSFIFGAIGSAFANLGGAIIGGTIGILFAFVARKVSLWSLIVGRVPGKVRRGVGIGVSAVKITVIALLIGLAVLLVLGVVLLG